MRRLTLPILVLALIPAGCSRQRTAKDAPPEEPAELLSTVQVENPRASIQFAHGFQTLGQKTWRWTASKFGVVLRPPAGAAQNGGRLELNFTIPDVIFNKLGPITLSASFDGQALEPQTYTHAGDYVYARDLPAQALGGDGASVEFASDKALPPDEDQRELALIVTSVGLIGK